MPTSQNTIPTTTTRKIIVPITLALRFGVTMTPRAKSIAWPNPPPCGRSGRGIHRMFHLRTPAALALLTLVAHATAANARDVREKWIHRSAEQGVHVSTNPKAVAKDFAGWMDQIEQSGQISGMAAAIVKDDTVLLQRGIGYADASRDEHVTVDSPFRLASLSKAFASTLT